MTTLSSSLAGSRIVARRFDLRLRCPRCSANLSATNRLASDCLKCGLFLRDVGGIIHALPPVRTDHYAQFIADYERIRVAEGRGSARDDFYLALPYRDVSGRNSSQWRIRARTWDFLMKRVLAPAFLRPASILDLGAGNCWMSFRLARAGYKPVAVDLHDNSFDGMGAAEHFRKSLPKLFPRFRAELAHLPFQDEQFDAAIFNASFHYVEDAAAVLAEALRCVKPGGRIVICDTPWYSCDESGYEMVQERRMSFMKRYGTASASLQSVEFLTDERLQSLEELLSIRWTVYSPNYGPQWAMRPFIAKLRNRREPAQFRIYVIQKAAASSDART